KGSDSLRPSTRRRPGISASRRYSVTVMTSREIYGQATGQPGVHTAEKGDVLDSACLAPDPAPAPTRAQGLVHDPLSWEVSIGRPPDNDLARQESRDRRDHYNR